MLVFFFKQKTAYEMRISDWSSDVCSSDLSFQEAQKIGLAGTSVNVRMPTRRSLSERSEEQSGLTSPMTVPASPQDEAVEPSQTIINMKNVQIIIKKESNDEPKQPAQTAPVHGRILTTKKQNKKKKRI